MIKNLTLMILPLFATIHLHTQCDLQVKRVTIYKDGTAFIEKEGRCQVENGRIKLNQIKAPITSGNNYNSRNQTVANKIILGTIKAESSNAEIQAVYTAAEKVIGNYVSTSEMIKANIGKIAEVTKKDGQVVKGTIRYLETAQVISSASRTYRLVLKRNKGLSFVDMQEIQALNILNESPKALSQTYVFAKIKGQRKSADIKLSYLQKGLSWLPNYGIEIVDSSHLSLDFGATILNDIVEINDGQVDLVIGVPTFEYSTVGDPLMTNYRVIDFLSALSKQPNTNGPSIRKVNPSSQRFSPYTVESYGSNQFPKFDGSSMSDAYIYTLEDVTLAPKGRYTKRIMRTDIEYNSFYSVDIASNEALLGSSSRKRDNNEGGRTNQVWRTISFNNTSGMPLTTGPVFFTSPDAQGDVPISQSSLSYTAENLNAQVRMSVVPSIYVVDKEKEVSREDLDYDELVTINSTIEVTNLSNKPVSMKINREILGKMLESNIHWLIKDSVTKLQSLNARNLVCWELEVSANGKATISYSYEIIVD